MNFDLTTEQTMLLKMIKEFADEEVAPGAVERDRTKGISIRNLSAISENGHYGITISRGIWWCS